MFLSLYILISIIVFNKYFVFNYILNTITESGTKLLRGYRELATDVDRPKDITHLVFVVHGIGQKMDIGGRILQNTAL